LPLTHLSVRETRANLALLAVRLGEVETWEEVSTAAITEALELLHIFDSMNATRQGNAKNATAIWPGGRSIIGLNLQRESD